MPVTCPKCGASAPDDAKFCEVDGTRLAGDVASIEYVSPVAAPVAEASEAPADDGCPHCHAAAAANVDGWCSACGRRWRIAPVAGRDHKEIPISPKFGGVTDRGKRHPINEDDFAIAAVERADPTMPEVQVLVVCDGVSSSEDAHRASAIAAQSICAELTREIDSDDIGGALVKAIANANLAVNALAPAMPGAASDPPETTVVAAVVRGREAVIAWVGDSRAYWIKGDDKPTTPNSCPLTRDHSWMNDVIESGEMTAEAAAKDRLAHAITRCLGGGSSDDPDGSAPTIATFAPPDGASGWLLLCTDGLWNYGDRPEQISELVAEAESAGSAPDAATIARSLVAWANSQGGRDNITVVLVRLGE